MKTFKCSCGCEEFILVQDLLQYGNITSNGIFKSNPKKVLRKHNKFWCAKCEKTFIIGVDSKVIDITDYSERETEQ